MRSLHFIIIIIIIIIIKMPIKYHVLIQNIQFLKLPAYSSLTYHKITLSHIFLWRMINNLLYPKYPRQPNDF